LTCCSASRGWAAWAGRRPSTASPSPPPQPGYGTWRGGTSYAIALAAARIIEAVLYDEHQVLPVSSLLTGYAGISDVCLSVPSVANRAGVQRVLPVPLSGEERDGLHRSAQRFAPCSTSWRSDLGLCESWPPGGCFRERRGTA